MASKDGRSQIWYADGNGNVEGYTETVDDIVDTIISTYNEHFGTDIQIWTPETKTLQVGGAVPNWDAYEKIEMQINGWFKTLVSGTVYTYGKVENNVLILYGKNNGDDTGVLWLPVVSEEGKILYFSLDQSFKDVFSQRIGKITQSSVIVSSLNIGDDVQNWNEMTLVE